MQRMVETTMSRTPSSSHSRTRSSLSRLAPSARRMIKIIDLDPPYRGAQTHPQSQHYTVPLTPHGHRHRVRAPEIRRLSKTHPTCAPAQLARLPYQALHMWLMLSNIQPPGIANNLVLLSSNSDGDTTKQSMESKDEDFDWIPPMQHHRDDSSDDGRSSHIHTVTTSYSSDQGGGDDATS